MVFRDSIKFFSLNTVESSMVMVKYLLFIIVFLLSFMINISVSRGETGKNIKMDDMDVYYKKTKVFRDWDRKESSISKEEKKLLSLYPEQFNKKETKSQPEIKAPEVKVFKNIIMGTVRLESPKTMGKTSQTPVADSILNPSIMPFKSKEKLQIAEKENKALIYGNSFEQDCYLSKKDCGFPIFQEVQQYRNKISPQKERVDTSRFPIDLQAN